MATDFPAAQTFKVTENQRFEHVFGWQDGCDADETAQVLGVHAACLLL